MEAGVWAPAFGKPSLARLRRKAALGMWSAVIGYSDLVRCADWGREEGRYEAFTPCFPIGGLGWGGVECIPSGLGRYLGVGVGRPSECCRGDATSLRWSYSCGASSLQFH